MNAHLLHTGSFRAIFSYTIPFLPLRNLAHKRRILPKVYEEYTLHHHSWVFIL
jgi:hypothetical protein